ncbi:DUF3995 domain-containing protein [Parapedobacter tibetensis]|uniref:DUF3995 domain-containing protein n=1 Tax=Parapedobacter tibetensis TaxID=2972951 RepID=UPI00214DDABA|nr:DUF3995 domain-containing protein [Parapedobacter tibetensis]
METALAAINAFIFLLLAALHLYWVTGGGGGMDATIPMDSNGRKLFRPGRAITLVVALGLFLFALCNLAFAGWLQVGLDPLHIRYGILLIAIIFLMRAIGDFRYIGLTKRHKQSPFAHWDTRLYTPLCLVLTINHWLLYTL